MSCQMRARQLPEQFLDEITGGGHGVRSGRLVWDDAGTLLPVLAFWRRWCRIGDWWELFGRLGDDWESSIPCCIGCRGGPSLASSR